MFNKRFSRHSYWIIVLLVMAIVPTAAQQADPNTPAPDVAVLDSIEAWKERNHSRHAWEYIISFPGELINFPLDLLFEATERTIVFAHERKLAARLTNWLTSDDGLTGLRPSYAASSGVGLKFFHKEFLGPASRLNIGAATGDDFRQRYYFSLSRLSLFNGRLSAGMSLDYTNLPDERFYGIGMSAAQDNEADFARERISFTVAAGPKIATKTFIDFTGGLDINSILPGRQKQLPNLGTVFDVSQLPGAISDVRLGHAGIQLEHLAQNHPGHPTSGANFQLGASIFRQINQDKQFGFNVFNAEIEQIINLFHGRVLALRIAGQIVSRQKSKSTPFYYLSEIGEDGTVRGFRRGRFRDRDLALASAEYRYPLRLRRGNGLDAHLFIDAGQVGPDIPGNFDRDQTEFSFGGGFRVWNSKGLVTRLDIAKSSEQFRIHFRLN